MPKVNPITLPQTNKSAESTVAKDNASVQPSNQKSVVATISDDLEIASIDGENARKPEKDLEIGPQRMTKEDALADLMVYTIEHRNEDPLVLGRSQAVLTPFSSGSSFTWGHFFRFILCRKNSPAN